MPLTEETTIGGGGGGDHRRWEGDPFPVSRMRRLLCRRHRGGSGDADSDSYANENETENETENPQRHSHPNAVVVPAFIVSLLLSVSIGLTVGIVPEVLTDRYARLYRGYGSGSGSGVTTGNITDLFIADIVVAAAANVDGGGPEPLSSPPLSPPPPPPCWQFDTGTMPPPCVLGADDAQTGSARATFFQNAMTLFFNALIGSHSDKHGRRRPLLVSVVLNTLVPVSLLAVQLSETVPPFWFYLANASTGVVSYTTLVFAVLSDGCPGGDRAGRFAANMAGFYCGFALAPAAATEMSHTAASFWSLGLMLVALAFAAAFLPETLPVAVAVPVVVEDGRHGVDETGGRDSAGDSPSVPLLSEEDGDQQHSSLSSLVPAEESSSLSSSLSSSSSTSSIEDESAATGCWKATVALLLRPLEEMTILARDRVLVLVALASFLSAAVYSTDSSLVLFYIEEHLNVREADIAGMFFCMGLLGAVLQGIGIRPLIGLMGERGLLVVSFCSGTLHNFLYGVASTKAEITAALSLSQVTKLGYPVLSSLASQRVGIGEQGRVQGALLALNALAGALGPVSMNWIYTHTKDNGGGGDGNGNDDDASSSSGSFLGPGTMFLLAAGLYGLGTVVVILISVHREEGEGGGTGAAGAAGGGVSFPKGSGATSNNNNNNNNSSSSSNTRTATATMTDSDSVVSPSWESGSGDLEEPLLLLRLGEESHAI